MITTTAYNALSYMIITLGITCPKLHDHYPGKNAQSYIKYIISNNHIQPLISDVCLRHHN